MIFQIKDFFPEFFDVKYDVFIFLVLIFDESMNILHYFILFICWFYFFLPLRLDITIGTFFPYVNVAKRMKNIKIYIISVWCKNIIEIKLIIS